MKAGKNKKTKLAGKLQKSKKPLEKLEHKLSEEPITKRG